VTNAVLHEHEVVAWTLRDGSILAIHNSILNYVITHYSVT